MNCEKCQEQLSDYLDGTLAAGRRALLSGHLADCAECAEARDELASIVGAARECREELFAPPDARAMWLRISNVIEGERALRPAATAAASNAPARRESVWARVFRRRWELTLPQMAAAVAAICVSVSFLTAVGVRGLMDAQTAREAAAANTSSRPVAGQSSYPQGGYLRQQQARISYLQQRVEQRKAAWNPRVRESFERSLDVLDQAVVDSLDELKRNPHDEVSEETLNAAMRDKLELLREFGEQ